MNRSLLSDGQAQVWQIAAEVLAEYRIDPVTTDENKHAAPYQALLNRLANDPLIRQDRYTGCLIADKQVANSYINWLTTKCLEADRLVKKNLPSTVLPVDFNRMDFGGSTSGAWELDFTQRMYMGGVERPLSTARAMLTLAAGADLYSTKLCITYFANSCIMQPTGGNHRLMAYKLLGIAGFSADKLRAGKVLVYEDIPDERLNRALLCLERLERSPDPRESKIGAIGDEERILRLATKFGADASDSGPNELGRFFEQDLLDNPAPSPYNQKNPFLDLLGDYAAAYYPADKAGPSRAWFTRAYAGKNTEDHLPENQKAIRKRLRAWRKMQPGPRP
jgi:hypothetical protein